MSDAIKFITGKKYNNMNSKGLLFLVTLVTPTLILDIVWVRLYFTGKPWDDLTLSANISPAFGLWGIFSMCCSGLIWFILILSLRNNKQPRIADNDDPTKDIKKQ